MVINQLNTNPANTGLESGAHLALYVCMYISTIVVWFFVFFREPLELFFIY